MKKRPQGNFILCTKEIDMMNWKVTKMVVEHPHGKENKEIIIKRN